MEELGSNSLGSYTVCVCVCTTAICQSPPPVRKFPV